jgi:RNA polymerase sigma-70 factor (ECF subfamily)
MKLRSRDRRKESAIDPLLPEFDENACRIEEPWGRLATPEEILEREELRRGVLYKISQLPDDYRIILLLRDIEEMTTREVAVALELTETNVKVRLHRARSALKKLIEAELKGET